MTCMKSYNVAPWAFSNLSNVTQADGRTLQPDFIRLFALLQISTDTCQSCFSPLSASFASFEYERKRQSKPQRIWNPYLNIETSEVSIAADWEETDCLVSKRSQFEPLCQVKMPLFKNTRPLLPHSLSDILSRSISKMQIGQFFSPLWQAVGQLGGLLESDSGLDGCPFEFLLDWKLIRRTHPLTATELHVSWPPERETHS